MNRAPSPLHADLVALLHAARSAERDLFGMLSPEVRDAPTEDGGWSPKDVQAHLAAWRFIEARRIAAATRGDGVPPAGDPLPDDPTDESNERLHSSHANQSWEAVAAEADASVEALVEAIGQASSAVLCECDGMAAGIGANAANHATGHLSDIARLGGDLERYGRFAGEVEAILRRNHLMPRDSGTMLYNIACHRALTGELHDARRLLRDAFARRGDLRDFAGTDPDLVTLADELAAPA